MFDLIQKRKRIAQVILALLIIPFAFFGMESYTRSFGSKDDVAAVNGTAITQREFAEELRRQQDRLRQAFGPNVNAEALDTPETRRALLDSLIDRRLVAEAAMRAGLSVSNEALRATIAAVPAFQSDGQFSRERYETLLRAQGMAPQTFESQLRHDMLLSQLGEAVGGTAFVSRTVSERLAALLGERRELREALVEARPFLVQADVGAARVRAYFDAHPEEFRVPERVRAEYLVLSVDALRSLEKVTDAALQAAYEARASQYGVAEQRRASHILVPTKAEAERLAAEARRAPGRFAELAKQHSQDPGSAAKGGDLGFFAKGTMVPGFEAAAFRQKPGEIGEPVQSEFGWHVIRVTGIQPAKLKSFAEVRGELLEELSRQQASRRFAESAEGFSNTVYEQPDSLKPAAERFQLQVQTSGWLPRNAGPEAGVLANAKLLAALFSDDAVKAKRNTDAVEVSPGVLVSARVLEHRPAAQKPFEEVRAEIERRLRAEEAARLAQKAGEAKLEALRAGSDAGVAWSAPRTVSRRSAQGVPSGALRPLLAADPAKLPAYAGAARGDEGYVLYRVDKVLPAEARSDAQKSADLVREAQLVGTRQMEAYVASLRARADIEIHAANLERKP